MSTENSPPAQIEFSDFEKVDLRVGTVKSAIKVPDTDKLLQLQVSFGSFERQIVAGVGKCYAPEALVGKQYVFVVNLAPRKLRGVESHGMLLAAAGEPPFLALIHPNGPVADGTSAG